MDRRHFIQSASLMAATAASMVAETPPRQALAQGSFLGVRHDNLSATNGIADIDGRAGVPLLACPSSKILRHRAAQIKGGSGSFC